MTSSSIHVDPVNENASIAMAEEAIRKASAATQAAAADSAGAEEQKRHAQSDIAEIGPDLLMESTGFTSASIVNTVVESVSEARNDPAHSADAGEMVDLGLAEQPTSFDAIAPVREIQTEFQGPTLGEQFNMVTDIFAALNEDMSGAKASEDVCDEMTAVAECKQVMGLANERVLSGAQYVISNAPAFGGSGGHQMAIVDRKQAQDELDALKRMENKPFDHPAAQSIPGFKDPALSMANGPTAPTSSMLTEEEGALA